MDEELLTFTYDLFGVQIKSCPFTANTEKQFKPERATAKLFTTPETCYDFFKNHVEPFEIAVTSGDSKLCIAKVVLPLVSK